MEIDELLDDDASESTYDDNEIDDITIPVKIADSDATDAVNEQ